MARQRWMLATILLAGAWRGTCQPVTTAINARQTKLGGPAANRPANCLVGQTWLATDTGVLSYCATSGSPGTWRTLTTGTGGGGLCTVTLSATPVFDASQCSAFSLTLGATAVTSTTLVNATAGQQLTFIITQDATGGRGFAWPSNVTNACAISGTPNVSTMVTAIYNGATAAATDCSTTETATLIAGPTRSAPAAPSSGLNCWFDALTGGGTLKCKDSGGNVRAAVLTASTGTPQQFVTYIDQNGVPQTGAVSFTRVCEVHIWGSGPGQALQNTDGEPASCLNGFGAVETVTAVKCWANAGSPTVMPAITGGSNILSGNLTCGSGAWAAGTLSGTPTLASAGSIDVNVVAAGGTATNIRVAITLSR